jgi:integrase
MHWPGPASSCLKNALPHSGQIMSHAFRRGLATTLHRLGVPDKTIQAILRHSNVGVTQACYIKTVSDDVAAAMLSLEYVM